MTSIEDIIKNVDTKTLLERSVTVWRPILASECQVYVFGENYIAKRFDQINYKFCEKNEAKEILVDNLYALLRYKYFTQSSEEVDEKIAKIVSSFTANLKTTLVRVSFDKSANARIVKMLPDSCVAFRNGVFDFKKNKWLFKYEAIELKNISNTLYKYTPEYIIFWYFDYDFEPLDISVMDMSLSEFLEVMKEIVKTQPNYCFELMYNISHDASHSFSYDKFEHLCQILGYTVLQSFSQHFVMLIGSGQNGKNSLFDGCFTTKVVPSVASNDLDAIENDRFITGSLENKYHNIFLETSAKTYTESKMIKNLTGSMYQTIEQKGVNKYSSVINCKYIFAGNDQEFIKFSDNTTGFRRRINMLEISYHWDAQKRFLSKGDYYDTTFSDSLAELKDDVQNTTVYIYFAMYGILSATADFTKNFRFTHNDWSQKYSDIDVDLKDAIERLTMSHFIDYAKSSDKAYEDGKSMFFGMDRKRLYQSRTLTYLGYTTYDKMLEGFESDEVVSAYFVDNDIYLSVKTLQSVLKNILPTNVFTQALKKIYSIQTIALTGNKAYIKCSFATGKLKVIV